MRARDVIVALDFKDWEACRLFLKKFPGQSLFVKVGMELYYQMGPQILYHLKETGHRVFLDLKLHDIPNTVYQASRGLARYQPDMLNYHAAGGCKMMEAGKQGLIDGGSPQTLTLAVTQLTSTSPEQIREEQLLEVDLATSVCHYAGLSKQAGLDGVVASVHEAPTLAEQYGADFLLVTPGIRLAESPSDDQHRTASPEQARQMGSHYLVVGRPITQSSDPQGSYHQICQQFFNKGSV